MDFEFRENRSRETEKGTNTQAFFNFFKSMFGAGILTMTNSFSRVGLQLGLLTFTLCTIVVYVTIYMLLECRIHASALAGREMRSYEDVAGFILGRRGKLAVQYSVGLLQLLFCTGFLIVLCENMHSVFPDLGEHSVIWIFMPLLVLLSWIPNLKDMWLISALGLMVYVCGVVMFSTYSGFIDYHQPDDIYSWKWSDIPHFFGVATYAMEGICLVVPTALSLHKTEDASPVIFSSLFLYAGITVSFAAFTFVAGLGSCDLITDCLEKGFITTAVRLALSTALILTHPVYIVVPAKIIEDQFLFPFQYYSIQQIETNPSSKSKSTAMEDIGCCESFFNFSASARKSKAIRTVLVAITCAITSSGVSFSTFSGLVGSLLTTLVGFIIPSIMWLRLYRVVGSPPVLTSAVIDNDENADRATAPLLGANSENVGVDQSIAPYSASQDTMGNSSLFTLLSGPLSGINASRNSGAGGIFASSSTDEPLSPARSWVYSSFVGDGSNYTGSNINPNDIGPISKLHPGLRSGDVFSAGNRSRGNSEQVTDEQIAGCKANGSLSNSDWLSKMFSWGNSRKSSSFFKGSSSSKQDPQLDPRLQSSSAVSSEDDSFFLLNNALVERDDGGVIFSPLDDSNGVQREFFRDSILDYDAKTRISSGRTYKLPAFTWKGYLLITFTLTAGFVAMVAGAVGGISALI
jgi:amino acid permease